MYYLKSSENNTLAELTYEDIRAAGCNPQDYQDVIPFTLDGSRVYIPQAVLRYYNPKVPITKHRIRYLDPDFFNARIKDAADAEQPLQYNTTSGRSPAYGSYAWIKVPFDQGTCYDLSDTDLTKFLMLVTTSDNQKMIAPDIYTYEVIDYLSKVFGLAPATIQVMLRELKKKDMVYQNDQGEWLFAEDLFVRGHITKTEHKKAAAQGYRYVRMYFPAITQMYRSPELNNALKYLPAMLPYLHKDLNVFCANPFQQDPFLVAPLTGRQLCLAGGYAATGYSALTQVYYNGLIQTSKGKESIMTRLTEPFHGLKKGSILLNPRVFFAGNGVLADELEPLFLRKPRGHYRKRRKKREEN